MSLFLRSLHLHLHLAFIIGTRDGHGEYDYSNGDRYCGEFREGFRQGSGKLYSRDGYWYDGQWLRGLKHGHGKLYFSEGVYEGAFSMGRREGIGSLDYVNGDVYKVKYCIVSQHIPYSFILLLFCSFNYISFP